VSSPSLVIRAAGLDDTALLLAFIAELADYERLGDAMVATDTQLREALFGARPAAEALIAELDGAPAGFALFFQNFSTFLSRRGIYLEDLYVRAACRRRGVGRALLQAVASIAVTRGCGRLEWSVLDWNQDAWRFYESLGAMPMTDWTTFRLTGDALARFGAGPVPSR